VADRMFAFICELDPGDDVEDSSLWVKANPALGVLLDLKEMEREWQRMRLIPQQRANFITKNLCVTVDSSEAAYLPMELLNRNRDRIDMEQLLGRTCYGGYDLSSREDFTAAVLLFPLDDGRWFVLHHSWTTRRKVELDNEKIDYNHFAMLGLLTICDGEYVPQDEVFKWFKQMGGGSGIYEVLNIGYDPANAVWLNRALEAEGFATEIVRQGPLTLNDPMKSFREAMMDGKIVTNDDPMLRWYMHNVRLRNNYQDKEKENWMPTKQNRYRKIDGFAALIDAWCVATRNMPTYQVSDDDIGNIAVYDLSELRR
jgi:phage terminase large subunit-like protein